MVESFAHTRPILSEADNLFDVHADRLFVAVFDRKNSQIDVYHRRTAVLCSRIKDVSVKKVGSRSSFIKRYTGLTKYESWVYWLDEQRNICKLDMKSLTVSRQSMDYDIETITI